MKKTLLLLAVIAACIITPPLHAQLLLSSEKLPTFEVTTVKPGDPSATGSHWRSSGGRFEIAHYTLKRLIMSAYDAKSTSQVLGGPDWIDSKTFDIAGKVDDEQVQRMSSLPWPERNKQLHLMIQALLADRFHLQVKIETRTLPVYALVQTKNGSKLTPLPPADTPEGKDRKRGSISTSNTRLTATGITMENFAENLAGMPESGNRVVLDRTGLKGDYDIKLNWTSADSPQTPTATDPELFTALQEQLGLKLEPQKDAIQVLIVESAQLPTTD
jgi:uncharacterized protein (TIGR03435 family)